MTTPVFFLTGLPQHGKSTARKYLCNKLQLRGASCSDFLYPELARLWGVSEAYLRAQPKEELRPHLVALGNLMTAQDAGRLVGLALDDGRRVVDGIRRISEFDSAVRHARTRGLRPISIWVSRTGASVPDIRDNTQSTLMRLVDHRLTAGSVEQLQDKLGRLLSRTGLDGLVD